MALTLAGALKAYLEAAGLGITVFTDDVPPRAVVKNADGTLKAPYVVITPAIADRLDPMEDGTVLSGAEEIQLDLWEQWRDKGDNVKESPTLARAVTKALQGATLAYGPNTAPVQVYALKQVGRRRQLDRNQRLIRHVYQVDAVQSY